MPTVEKYKRMDGPSEPALLNPKQRMYLFPFHPWPARPSPNQ